VGGASWLHSATLAWHVAKFVWQVAAVVCAFVKFVLHDPKFVLHDPKFVLHDPKFVLHDPKPVVHVPRFVCALFSSVVQVFSSVVQLSLAAHAMVVKKDTKSSPIITAIINIPFMMQSPICLTTVNKNGFVEPTPYGGIVLSLKSYITSSRVKQQNAISPLHSHLAPPYFW